MSSKKKLAGRIIVIISVILQISAFVYFQNKISSDLLKITSLIMFPLYFVITSFYFFYFVNIVYNLFAPTHWINTNSKYLSYHEPIILEQERELEDEENLLKKYPTYYSIYYKPKFNISSSRSNSDDADNTLINNSIRIESNSSDNFNKYIDISPKNYTHSPIAKDGKMCIITIQIPVYTESFNSTLIKTFDNMVNVCEQFNNTNDNYKINIFINDDGLQKVDEVEKKLRLNYYNSNKNIFYIARPIENREGKFKKASNMNFCLRQVLCANYFNPFTYNKYSWEYLSNKYKFIYKSNCDDFVIGKYILLFDSDSKMNSDCVEKLIYEIEFDPKIGFLQMKTSTMQICWNKWENIITYFTNTIYGINFLYSCSNGFPAPLVGHNCLIKFSALMDVEKHINGYAPREYTSWKVWDDSRVSEDFVMSLNMMHLGYFGKYIYYDCGMLEGVTLNIIDEIIKLKKYMYGINEIIFYPITKWYINGITTDIFSLFVTTTNIDLFTKYALISYMGSYYAIALSPILASVCYIVGLTNSLGFNDLISGSYYELIIFVGIFYFLSVFSNILISIKNNINQNIIMLIYNQITYGFVLTCFFGSLPYHLVVSNIDYFLNLDSNWSTTNKEISKLSCFDFIKKFKILYIIGTITFISITIINLYYFVNLKINIFILSIPLYLTIILHLIYPLITF